jgi:HAD superfamily hydrolase (TIGR01490 family)
MNSNTPLGPGIAAFFDLDGTVIPEPSLESRFRTSLRRGGAIPFVNYCRWAVEALRLLPQGIIAVQHANKRYLTGVRTDAALQYLESIAFYEEALERVLWHARQAHEIVLVSGTLEALARLAATALECEMEARGIEVKPRVCATHLEERGGRWTGRLVGEPAYGHGKQRAIRELAREYSLDLCQCHGYGNSLLDRHMLAAVGHPHVVNPGRELAAIANQEDWPVRHWVQERKSSARVSTRAEEKIQEVEAAHE